MTPPLGRKLSFLFLELGIFVFWPMTWLGFFLPKMVLLCLGLCIFFLLVSFGEHEEKSEVAYHPLTILPVIGYFVVLLLYTVFSRAPWSSFLGVSGAMQGFETQLVYLGIFLVALMLGNSEKNALLRGMMVLHVIAGVYALLQWLHIDPLGTVWDREVLVNRSFSFLGNPNWLAAFMVMTMPLFFRFKKYLWLIWSFEWLVLLTTGSKAGFLAAAFLMVMTLWKEERKKFFLIGALAITGAATFLYFFYPDIALLLRSWNARTLLWNDTVRLLQTWPWGHGLDIFRFIYPPFSSINDFQYKDLLSTSDDPHNQILQLLFSTGPAGLLLFYGSVTLILWQHLKKKSSDFPLAIGVIAYLITNFFGFDTLATGAVFWLMLGMLARPVTVSGISPARVRLRNIDLDRWYVRTTSLLFALLFFALSWLNLTHFYANLQYEKSVGVLATGNASQSFALLEKALRIYPYDRVYYLQASEVLLAVEKNTPEQLQKVDHFLATASQLGSDIDPEESIFKAWLQIKQGHTEIGKRTFWEAMRRYPHRLKNYLIGFQIFKALDRPEEIAVMKQELIGLLPTYWNQPKTESGRIFQKNYPWLVELLEE